MKRSNYEALQNEIGKMYLLIENKVTEGHIPEKVASAINKQINQIKKYAKHKNRVKKSNSNSGLQKPMVITPAMAEFAKWPPEDLHSRVDVTKILCEYIKNNDLQNPSNRRQIIMDPVLKKLLQYNDDILTYPHMQKHLKVLFEPK
jgi:chromatin remodeling complex protein RSC6